MTDLQKMAELKVKENLNLKWQRDYVLNGIAYDSQNDRYRYKNMKLFVKNDFYLE